MSGNPAAPGDGDNGTDTETAPVPDTPQPEDVSGLKKALEAERRLKREAEARLKELQPLAQKAKETEEANKTELQRAIEALDGERRARSDAETKLLRFEVATDKGVPAPLVRFLHGNSREELEDAADSLLAALDTNGKKAPKAAARVDTGKPSTGGLDAMSPSELAAHVLD